MPLRAVLDALHTSKQLQVVYDGYHRTVEVHAIGESSTGKIVARVWQVSGGSRSEKDPPWRTFTLDKVHLPVIIDAASQAPREGYKRGDKGMRRIIAEL